MALILSLPDGRASSGGSSARPSDPFRRYPHSLAARRAGIFWFLCPPVWPIPPLASFSGCQTGGHLLVVPRPASLTHSAATLTLWLPDGRASSGGSSSRQSDPFRRDPHSWLPDERASSGGSSSRQSDPFRRDPHSLAARRAGIFWWLLGPPVWPIPPRPSLSGCQTGGHLLVVPRPARLTHSATNLLL